MNQNTFPASAAEISASLQVLFDALPFQRGTRTDNVALAYIEALRGMTLDAINAGIRKFLRGECDEVNPRFIPTPPELARIVRTAVVQHRVSQAVENIKRVTVREIPGERARMKLKVPLLQAAFGSQARMNELARANEAGFEAMVALAMNWGVQVAEETLVALNSPNAEQDWRAVRIRAWAAIEANPPPFLRNMQRIKAENAYRPVLFENVGLDEWNRLRKERQIPVGAKWVAALGIVYGPEPKQIQQAAE